jgi:hypothetical protein
VLANTEEDRWKRSGLPGWRRKAPPPRPPEEDEEDLEPAQTIEQVRKSYPDLQVWRTQPTTLTVFSGAFYPFQAVALGLSVDAYLHDRFRLSGLVTGGFAYGLKNKTAWSGYADSSIGVAVLRFASSTTVTLPIVAARFRQQEAGDGPVVRAVVPSSHSIEVQAGAFSGRYFLYRCLDDCDAMREPTYEDASRYVTIPYFGVRYVYYRLARSEQAPFRSTSRFQLGVDVLTAPFGAPDAALFNGYNDHPAHSPVGARVTTHLPGLKCAILGPCLSIGLSVGYLPSPSDVLASVNLEVF